MPIGPILRFKEYVLRNTRNTIQLRLHRMKDACLSDKADEIQGFVDRNNIMNFSDGHSPSPKDHHPSSVQMGQH